MVTTFLLGLTFLFIQINEYVHIGFSPQDTAQGTIFYGLTGLHGAHVTIGLMLLAFVTIRAFRGHLLGGRLPRHGGARASTGTSSTSCGSSCTSPSTSSERGRAPTRCDLRARPSGPALRARRLRRGDDRRARDPGALGAGLLDGELAFHATLAVAGHGAVERVLAGLEVDGELGHAAVRDDRRPCR